MIQAATSTRPSAANTVHATIGSRRRRGAGTLQHRHDVEAARDAVDDHEPQPEHQESPEQRGGAGREVLDRELHGALEIGKAQRRSLDRAQLPVGGAIIEALPAFTRKIRMRPTTTTVRTRPRTPSTRPGVSRVAGHRRAATRGPRQQRPEIPVSTSRAARKAPPMSGIATSSRKIESVTPCTTTICQLAAVSRAPRLRALRTIPR